MTDGGDYYPVSNVTTTNTMSLERRREIMKNVYRPPLGTNPVKVFVYNKVNGEFIQEYQQIKKASVGLCIDKGNISLAITNRHSIKNYIFSPVYLGQKCNPLTFNIKKEFDSISNKNTSYYI